MATGGPGGPNLGIGKGGGPTITSFTISTPTFTFGGMPFSQYSWPLPPAPLPPLQTTVQQNLLSTTLFTPPVLYTLRGPLYTKPIGPEYPAGLRWWAGNVQRSPAVVTSLPVGEIVTDLSPRGPSYPVQLRTWSQSLSLPASVPVIAYTLRGPLYTNPRGPEYHIQLRSWFGAIPPTVTVVQFPFNQDDWPLARAPQQPALSWTFSYNLNLIGQDKLPTGEVVTDLPPRAPQQPIPIFTATYLKTLIGQDQLPTGAKVSDLAPRDYQRAIDLRTWIQSVNLALTLTVPDRPKNQFDWPNPVLSVRQARTWTSFYNLDLIGQDKLPFRQQDWPNPTQPYRQPTLASWIDRAKAYLQPPLRQTDWPVPRAPQQPALSWTASYNLNLIGQDKLPIRQQDWPLPRDFRQPDAHGVREFTFTPSLSLYYPPFTGLLPRNQYNWPNPQQPAEMRSRYNFIYDTQTLYPTFVNPIPPPPEPSPPTDEHIIYNAGNEWQMLDRIREPGPVGWR